jgi:quinol monooxygenase YgiN
MPRIVFARIKAKKDKIEEVGAGLRALVGPTRKEAGCIQYDLHQSSDDPSLFYFYEKWKDDQALAAHLQSAHIQAMARETSSFLAEPPEIQRVEGL